MNCPPHCYFWFDMPRERSIRVEKNQVDGLMSNPRQVVDQPKKAIFTHPAHGKVKIGIFCCLSICCWAKQKYFGSPVMTEKIYAGLNLICYFDFSLLLIRPEPLLYCIRRLQMLLERKNMSVFGTSTTVFQVLYSLATCSFQLVSWALKLETCFLNLLFPFSHWPNLAYLGGWASRPDFCTASFLSLV